MSIIKGPEETYFIYNDMIRKSSDPILKNMHEYTPKNIFKSNEKTIYNNMFNYIKNICDELEIDIKCSATGPKGLMVILCTCHQQCDDDDIKCCRGSYYEGFKIYFVDKEDAMAFKLRWL